MAKGFDYGTAILVAATKNKKNETIIKSERNCFIDVGKDFEDMIEKSEYNYIVDEENGEEKFYIIGKDAIVLDNLYSHKDDSGTRVSKLRRPMASMVINSNTEKKAIKMLKHISQSLLGKPSYEGEVCVLSVPSAPLDGTINTTFHSSMCESFVKELGYDTVILNEALAVVYATNPTAEVDGEKLNFTGIGMSFGGGGSNGCVAYKGKDTIRLSVAKGGDWIDSEVSKVTPLSSSQVTVAKEQGVRIGKSNDLKKLDLANPDYEDEVLGALYIYYRALIQEVVENFKKAFLKEGTTFNAPLEVTISGGTSKPEGFCELVKKVIDDVGWPFEIKEVRKAKEPLQATAIGCLTAAISREKKNKVQQQKVEEPTPEEPKAEEAKVEEPTPEEPKGE